MELSIEQNRIPVEVCHNRRARRYLIRVRSDGSLRVTIPRFGNRIDAMNFVERQHDWILKHRALMIARKPPERPLIHGAMFWFRGEKVTINIRSESGNQIVTFGDQQVISRKELSDWRPVIEAHLRKLASLELPPRVQQLARFHRLEARRVTIRNQKSRWGSCSARKTISLNWRLIQAPMFVLDYVIVHELMHLKEMNHSPRFWGLVAAAYPRYQEAEAWLKRFGPDLR